MLCCFSTCVEHTQSDMIKNFACFVGTTVVLSVPCSCMTSRSIWRTRTWNDGCENYVIMLIATLSSCLLAIRATCDTCVLSRLTRPKRLQVRRCCRCCRYDEFSPALQLWVVQTWSCMIVAARCYASEAYYYYYYYLFIFNPVLVFKVLRLSLKPG